MAFAKEHNPLDPDSTPDYDGWGWDDWWGCADWVTWHKMNVAKYGQVKADNKFVEAWLDGLSSASGGRGKAEGSGAIFDSVPIDCRSFDTGFKEYIKKPANKRLYDVVFSGIGGTIGGAVSGSVTVVENVGSTIVGASKAVKIVVPVLIIGGLGLAIWGGVRMVQRLT